MLIALHEVGFFNVISHVKLVLSGNYGPDISLLTLGSGTRINLQKRQAQILFYYFWRCVEIHSV